VQVRNALADDMKKEGIDDNPANCFQFLLDRVKANLHLVLGMSPVGEAFR
jgi:dynein heavy chain